MQSLLVAKLYFGKRTAICLRCMVKDYETVYSSSQCIGKLAVHSLLALHSVPVAPTGDLAFAQHFRAWRPNVNKL